MERCNDYETLIERMLADEIDDADRDRLLAHSERCRACREYVELHHRLLGSELDTDLPTDEELSYVRTAVLERIRTQDLPRVNSLNIRLHPRLRAGVDPDRPGPSAQNRELIRNTARDIASPDLSDALSRLAETLRKSRQTR